MESLPSNSTSPNNPPETTDGMTAKVVKGSIWVLIGQVLPLLATFIATPFVIRALGTESYGVLILIGLISTYFTFADMGMGLASTKFGSEAFALGSSEKEGEVVVTALTISAISSLAIAIPLIIFSGFIIREILKIPEHLERECILGLRLTAISFVLGVLSGVINTPQLTRLRMDINILINSGGKILMILVTPLVLHYGGGIAEACMVTLGSSILVFAGNFYTSARLQPDILNFRVNPAFKRQLIKFGQGAALYGAAFILIFNAEKFILSSLTSPKELAYYSIAYTLANMTTMFTLAIGQTLVPAFSQMQGSDKRKALNLLFNRSFKGSLIILLPAIMIMVVVGKPFFSIWAGEDFGKESIIPFYILMVGVFFSLLMYIPNSILLAFGRTNLFAKTYWLEILPYILLAALLIKMYGILGAAAAWSIREFINGFIFFGFSKRYAGVSLNLKGYGQKLFLPLLVLVPPVIFALSIDNYSPFLVLITVVSIILYSIFIWRTLLSLDEKRWMVSLIPFISKNKQ